MLAILVSLSIVLLTGYFGEGSGGFFHRLQSGAQTVLSPIEDGASRAFKPVRDLVGWFGDVFDAKDENKQLKNDLAAARAESAASEALRRPSSATSPAPRRRRRPSTAPRRVPSVAPPSPRAKEVADRPSPRNEPPSIVAS